MRKVLKIIFVIVFILSIGINILFTGNWLLDSMSVPEVKYGKLKEDVPLALYMRDSGVYVTLPKGLVVKNSSPRNIATAGLFEPERFMIQVTSDRSLVDYEAEIIKPFGGLYSADTYYNFESEKYELPAQVP